MRSCRKVLRIELLELLEDAVLIRAVEVGRASLEVVVESGATVAFLVVEEHGLAASVTLVGVNILLQQLLFD